jgi:hypothetical protein
VIDEESPADGRAGVDLNAGCEPAELRNEPRQEWDAHAVQLMGKPVQQDGVEARVTEEDLKYALRGGVFPKNRIYLFPYGSQHRLALLRLPMSFEYVLDDEKRGAVPPQRSYRAGPFSASTLSSPSPGSRGAWIRASSLFVYIFGC